MKKPLILIAGPTASGKTKVSVMLAKIINGEIISADSMQIYKGMDIGTAKVSKEEAGGVPHYMIDELEPSTACNVAWFKEKVKGYIDFIHDKGKVPILVGGTGFYINAILYDTQFNNMDQNTSYRDYLMSISNKEGAEFLHKMLTEVDPISAMQIHPNNVKRVIRALEYYHETGLCISDHNLSEKSKKNINLSPYNYCFFTLSMERSVLYNRINERVDQMIKDGLVDEVRTFFDQGYDESYTSMKAIGYKEFFPYFRGESTLDECIEKLKKNTRNFAKRQQTWFRHQSPSTFIEVDALSFDIDKICMRILNDINKIL